MTSQDLSQILSQGPEMPKPALGWLRKYLSAIMFLGCGGKPLGYETENPPGSSDGCTWALWASIALDH